jgi:hypothetical protein
MHDGKSKVDLGYLSLGMDFAQSVAQEGSCGVFFHELAAGSVEGCKRTRSMSGIQEDITPCSFHD